MKPSLLLLSIASALLAGCSDSDSPLTPDTPQQPDFVSVEKAVSIDAGTTYQTMRGFGASDCWTADYVGQYWTRQRDAISELLFSTDIADGRAKGIGLSQWRVNLGGGTAAQGDASGIDDKTRRAASFLTGTGQYDWNNCRGQQYFMQRAKDMGCPSFVLFSNTPPVQFTRNGKGFSASGACSNLKEDAYDDFADYLATVAQHYLHAGYPVTHLSPVNEPQYNWDSGQEGSGWQNSEVARLIRELDRALTDKQADVTILPGEAGDWEYLYKTKGGCHTEQRHRRLLHPLFRGLHRQPEAYCQPPLRTQLLDRRHLERHAQGASAGGSSSPSQRHRAVAERVEHARRRLQQRGVRRL